MLVLVAVRELRGSVGFGCIASDLWVRWKFCSEELDCAFESDIDDTDPDAVSSEACQIPGGGPVCGWTVSGDGLDGRLLEAHRGNDERDCGRIARAGELA